MPQPSKSGRFWIARTKRHGVSYYVGRFPTRADAKRAEIQYRLERGWPTTYSEIGQEAYATQVMLGLRPEPRNVSSKREIKATFTCFCFEQLELTCRPTQNYIDLSPVLVHFLTAHGIDQLAELSVFHRGTLDLTHPTLPFINNAS